MRMITAQERIEGRGHNYSTFENAIPEAPQGELDQLLGDEWNCLISGTDKINNRAPVDDAWRMFHRAVEGIPQNVRKPEGQYLLDLRSDSLMRLGLVAESVIYNAEQSGRAAVLYQRARQSGNTELKAFQRVLCYLESADLERMSAAMRESMPWEAMRALHSWWDLPSFGRIPALK